MYVWCGVYVFGMMCMFCHVCTNISAPVLMLLYFKFTHTQCKGDWHIHSFHSQLFARHVGTFILFIIISILLHALQCTFMNWRIMFNYYGVLNQNEIMFKIEFDSIHPCIQFSKSIHAHHAHHAHHGGSVLIRNSKTCITTQIFPMLQFFLARKCIL